MRLRNNIKFAASTAAAMLITYSALPQRVTVMPRVEAAPVVVPAVDVHPMIAAPVPEPRHRDRDYDSDFPAHAEDTITKSYTLAATGRSVVIDNVWGSVHVIGTSSDEVKVTVKETFRGETEARIAQARKDVKLDITQQENALKLYVDGPFRCHDCDGGCDHEPLGYMVQMEFEVQIPTTTNLTVKTVNDGDVTVRNVKGDYVVRNVNGGVEMTDIAGSGMAKTVNGEVRVKFRENPTGNSSFSTVNGEVDLTFLPRLSADMRFKTFHGEILSDFQMAALPARQPSSEHNSGKFIFRADRFAGGRVGAGGPEIKVETLNGDIHILERHD